jgi:hypothetical protein
MTGKSRVVHCIGKANIDGELTITEDLSVLAPEGVETLLSEQVRLTRLYLKLVSSSCIRKRKRLVCTCHYHRGQIQNPY